MVVVDRLLQEFEILCGEGKEEEGGEGKYTLLYLPRSHQIWTNEEHFQGSIGN